MGSILEDSRVNELKHHTVFKNKNKGPYALGQRKEFFARRVARDSH